MHTLMQRISSLIYRRFKIIWFFITLIFLLFALYYNLERSYTSSYKDILEVAKDLSKQTDGFIEDLFQEVYTLPLYGSNISSCKSSGIYNDLEHIILNNPKISGLIISDEKHRPLCSTLPENDLGFSSNNYARTILGPFKMSLFEQPVYLIQQKIGNYYIDILIVSSVLKMILKTSNHISSSIVLYDQISKKNIIRIQHSDDHKGWIVSKNINSLSPEDSEIMYAIDALQSVEGILLVVFENKETVRNNLWYSELLIILSTLILSYLLHALISHNISKRYSLHHALKLAIKNNEFYPEYQPIFDKQINGFAGVEVLLRWQDNQDKIIMPDFFIEEAEATGLIVPITLQIIEIVFTQAANILKAYPGFHLAFNLSALHFRDALFFTKFYALQKQYNVPAQQILLEITERELLDKNDLIFTSKMQELRNNGFSLAVDDFGTGHASISYLQNFPFNYLKIDKLFIQAIGTKAITESLNDAIIRMAKSLNLIIIAEGVETKEQVDYLLTNDVRYLQGWYFSKAISIEHVHRLLQENKNELSH